MIIDHLAMLHSENEVGIPDRVAHCQISILLSAFCLYIKNYMVDGVHLLQGRKKGLL